LDDLGPVDESVDDGDDAGGVWEDLAPLGKGLVGCNEDGLGLVASGDDLVEEVGVAVVIGEVSELVNLCGAPHKSTNGETSVMWSGS
jgi:hypothetical protein